MLQWLFFICNPKKPVNQYADAEVADAAGEVADEVDATDTFE